MWERLACFYESNRINRVVLNNKYNDIFSLFRFLRKFGPRTWPDDIAQFPVQRRQIRTGGHPKAPRAPG